MIIKNCAKFCQTLIWFLHEQKRFRRFDLTASFSAKQEGWQANFAVKG